MSISPRFLDELRSRLTLSEVIGRRITVTRAGRESKACCPFHHEKSPSFTINDDKQFYHCFGCGAHGDVVNFVMQYDNLAFMDAVEMLAAEAGLSVPKPSAQDAKKAKEEKDLYALMEEATRYFEQMLYHPKNRDALSYMTERGLTPDILKLFRIGFAPDEPQAVRKFLLEKGYGDKDMISAGVLKPSSRGSEPYAFFRDRVMFPVPDRRGRIVAFGGRILPEHLRPPQKSDFTPPKYINSSETPLFHKGSMLYGEPMARRAAADGEVLVVVEGYLDVIACAQAGIHGALAPMGTAVTEEQILSLWKMIPGRNKVPVLCFDGDNAGRKAAQRVCERILPLLEPGCSVDFSFMPDGQDPDSLLRSGGAEALKAVISKTTPLFEFLWQSHIGGKSFNTPESRAGVIQDLNNDVARIANKDVQIHYKSLLKNKISDHFFAKKEYVREPYQLNNRPQKRFDAPGLGLKSPLKKPQMQKKIVFERVLLAAVINHPHIFEGVDETLMSMDFSQQSLKKIQQKVVGLLSSNPELPRDNILEELKKNGLSKEISDILNESVYVHASFCSPHADGSDVQAKWIAYWNDGQGAAFGNEIRNGWMQAYQELSTEEEEKLKNIIVTKSAEA